jgi:MerR family mercuric resistance operon transcriptional regulator
MDHAHGWTTYRSTGCKVESRTIPIAWKKKSMPHGGMTIGRLAKEAGVNVETIRYYQRRGLIEEPQKPAGGHRRYAQSAVRRIGFIRRAQGLGFSLAEVESLLKYSDGRSWKETRQIAEKKFSSLNLHINQLRKMRDELKSLIEKSRDGKGRGACPIITALGGED